MLVNVEIVHKYKKKKFSLSSQELACKDKIYAGKTPCSVSPCRVFFYSAQCQSVRSQTPLSVSQLRIFEKCSKIFRKINIGTPKTPWRCSKAKKNSLTPRCVGLRRVRNKKKNKFGILILFVMKSCALVRRHK